MRAGALIIALLLPHLATAQAKFPLADANCDHFSTPADLTVAIIVSFEPTRFATCFAANQFRNRPFTPASESLILNDIFDRQEAEWTPTPTPTATPTRTPTTTSIPTPTVTRTVTPTTTPTARFTATPSLTSTQTVTPSSTATQTNSPRPTSTSTASPSPTQTPTRTATPTRTPTGLAQQLAGTWQVTWNHGIESICFLNGLQQSCPLCVANSTYQVTAVIGQLDVLNLGTNEILGRGLPISVSGSSGTVHTQLTRSFPQTLCLGVVPQQVFDFTLTFQTNGQGSAQVAWTYGLNTNCAVCSPRDHATLVRIAGP